MGLNDAVPEAVAFVQFEILKPGAMTDLSGAETIKALAQSRYIPQNQNTSELAGTIHRLIRGKQGFPAVDAALMLATATSMLSCTSRKTMA